MKNLVLEITGKEMVAKATFRKNDHGCWRCVSADAPIEWFRRVRHMDVISDWLLRQHIAHRWVKPNFPSRRVDGVLEEAPTTVRGPHVNQHTEDSVEPQRPLPQMREGLPTSQHQDETAQFQIGSAGDTLLGRQQKTVNRAERDTAPDAR